MAAYGEADSVPSSLAAIEREKDARSAWYSDRWLLALLAVGLVFRLALALVRPSSEAALSVLPDQLEYLNLGRSMLNGSGLTLTDLTVRQSPAAYRMPLYPALVAVCAGDVLAVRVVQSILDVSAALAMYLTARRIASGWIACIAAAAILLNPYLVYFSTLVLSETLFTALLAWGIFLLTHPRADLKRAAILLLTLSVYAKPSAIGLGVFASAAMAFGDGVGRMLRNAIAGSIVVVLMLLPWAIRNKVAIDHWLWTTSNSGYTAYDSFNPRADGSSNQSHFKFSDGTALLPPVLAERARLGLPTRDPEFGSGEVERSTLLSRLAFEFAVTHPTRVIELAFAKLARFWSPVPLSADFGGRWLYVAVGGLYAVPLFLFAAIGLWRGKLSRRSKLILLLPAIYFSLVHSVFVGSLRYRVPCDVPLAVLAAAGVVSFFERKPAAESA